MRQIVAGGRDAFLLVQGGLAVGGCVITIGTAKAIADGGLDYRIKRWFGVPDDE